MSILQQGNEGHYQPNYSETGETKASSYHHTLLSSLRVHRCLDLTFAFIILLSYIMLCNAYIMYVVPYHFTLYIMLLFALIYYFHSLAKCTDFQREWDNIAMGHKQKFPSSSSQVSDLGQLERFTQLLGLINIEFLFIMHTQGGKKEVKFPRSKECERTLGDLNTLNCVVHNLAIKFQNNVIKNYTPWKCNHLPQMIKK